MLTDICTCVRLSEVKLVKTTSTTVQLSLDQAEIEAEFGHVAVRRISQFRLFLAISVQGGVSSLVLSQQHTLLALICKERVCCKSEIFKLHISK